MRRFLIPLKASAILSLLTAVASSLSAPSNTNRGFPERRPSSKNAALQRTSGSSSSNSRPRRRRPRPPLIDSDLLRFLSTKNVQQFVANRQNKQRGGADTTFILRTDRHKHRAAKQEAQWLRQYEPKAIRSLLLQQKNATVDERRVQRASHIVHSMALQRSERRRVRSYLQQRNQVWTNNNENNNSTTVLATLVDEKNSSSSSSSKQQEEEEESTAAVNSNNNNMEQVVELLLEYGLSPKDIADILIHTPSIAFMRPRPLAGCPQNGETLQQTLERVFVGLLMGRNSNNNNSTHSQQQQSSSSSVLRLRKYDARRVLRNTPGLLTSRGSHKAEQTVRLLTRTGVSGNSLSRRDQMNALPVLLSREPAAVFRLVAFLASDAVRMRIDKEIGPLLRRKECQDLLNAVAPVDTIPEWRSNSNNNNNAMDDKYNSIRTTVDDDASSSSSSSAALAAQVRREVVNDTYRRMSRTAWTLRHEIGTKDLGRAVAAYPSVLLLDAHRQILPTAQYLMDDLGIWQDDLPRVLQLYPALLRRDLEQMKLVVAYIESLEVANESLGVIFRSFPHLLTLDIEHDMAPVVDFLKRIGIANVGRFVTRLPPVLGYSVEKELQPKWDFLSRYVTDPRFEVSKFPAYFSYPLERSKSRFEYLTQVKRVPTALVSLDQVLCNGDRDFAVKVALDASEAQYAAFVRERQKKAAATPSSRKWQTTKSKQQQQRRRRRPPPPSSTTAAAVTG